MASVTLWNGIIVKEPLDYAGLAQTGPTTDDEVVQLVEAGLLDEETAARHCEHMARYFDRVCAALRQTDRYKADQETKIGDALTEEDLRKCWRESA